MNIDKMLEYQKKDLELIKLEREVNEGESKRILNEMVERSKDAQAKSVQLEKLAGELNAEYEKLSKTFEDNSSKLEMISKMNFDNVSEKELENYEKLANSINSNLAVLEKKLIHLAENINNVLNQFEQAKKNYNLAREKHSVHKQKYDELLAQLQPRIDEIQKQLGVLEKEVEPVLLSKYKQKRIDKTFPIFVSEYESTCGGCRMALSYAAMGTLKENGYIECEHCRRIIYKK